ncbi:ABC transporter [Talaromyces pinophilus]|uniref:ABC transporter n=1 Tax=Talaromyces pinophilus TaxID=128442 RepID=A0A478ECW2_TALPI|nr:ABC transporter [Talaromyces pinophilus]
MAVLVVLLVIIAVKTKRGNTADAASMGVALTNVMTFSQVLMNLVTSWTQMETSLAAIARIKSFAEETKLEKTTSKFTQLPPGWPSVGHIEIKNLTAKYQHSPRLVLQHISLIIPGCKKVAICGRSGRPISKGIQVQPVVLALNILGDLQIGHIFDSTAIELVLIGDSSIEPFKNSTRARRKLGDLM